MTIGDMPTFSLWGVAIAIAVAIVIFVVKYRSPTRWGFREVVKNPRFWRHWSRERDDISRQVEEAKTWSDDEVAAFTRAFILNAPSKREAWTEYSILRGLETRPHATVLSLLRDRSVYARLIQPNLKDTFQETPFDRACDLLGNSPPLEAVEAAAPFLSDPGEEIRKIAALVIGKTGHASITPLIRKALADDDEYVRSYALMGLKFALNRKSLAETVASDLFPDVLSLLRTTDTTHKAADILLRLRPARAIEYFLSDEALTADSPNLHDVLEALAEHRCQASPDRLLTLIASLEERDLKHPLNRAVGKALRLLGQQAREFDREFIRRRIDHPDERVAEGAAAGLIGSYGLEGFDQRIWDTTKSAGYASLTRPQQLYSAVFMCDAEIRNGGFSQYFVNSSGDQWRDALAGFEAVGFQERLSLVREAIAVFGADGPSTDRTVRQEQLSKVYRRNDEVFSSLESRYYKSREAMRVFMSRYVLSNPQAFLDRP
jgi:HEAT repeat protein